jgi:hypothetical protein
MQSCTGVAHWQMAQVHLRVAKIRAVSLNQSAAASTFEPEPTALSVSSTAWVSHPSQRSEQCSTAHDLSTAYPDINGRRVLALGAAKATQSSGEICSVRRARPTTSAHQCIRSALHERCTDMDSSSFHRSSTFRYVACCRVWPNTAWHPVHQSRNEHAPYRSLPAELPNGTTSITLAFQDARIPSGHVCSEGWHWCKQSVRSW